MGKKLSIYNYLLHTKDYYIPKTRSNKSCLDDSEARVGGSLQTEVANKEKD